MRSQNGQALHNILLAMPSRIQNAVRLALMLVTLHCLPVASSFALGGCPCSQFTERGFKQQRVGRSAACQQSNVGTRLTLFPTDFDFGTQISLTDSFINSLNNKETAEALAGPFFGLSLFPYLAFLYFLDLEENQTPKGVTIGFATCLLFVFLTIPAAIASQVLYGVSLADCDWLHGSAESLLTITNLVTVLAFRQALQAKEKGTYPPASAKSYWPMTWRVLGLTALAGISAAVPALSPGTFVHTPYLGGFMDLPESWVTWGRAQPENALTVACWIIHISSLVEFLVAMGFAWRWADVVENERWKGITWGLLPLHSSGITACIYHVFYNGIPLMVPIQAFLTCVGNTTAAYAAYRLAFSNGWRPSGLVQNFFDLFPGSENQKEVQTMPDARQLEQRRSSGQESNALVGFEDLGEALAKDTDYTFLLKLFAGCAVASYAVKYGETLLIFPFTDNLSLGVTLVLAPSMLNAFKWYKRSEDPTFEGWF